MSEKHSRQSFLGTNSEAQIARCVVGVVGLGGGGSHIVQQLAHIGFRNYVIYDNDITEETNLNRLIGAKRMDVKAETPKLHIAKTMIYGLEPEAKVEALACRWQENPGALRRCHLIFGCVDTYSGRNELEVCARRYLINYIDIGMDVIQVGNTPPVIGGQVILSIPGGLCMRCMEFINDSVLSEEGRRYGDAGGKPQVVWSNGVLASTAVGIGVDLITDWSQSIRSSLYLEYDGNRNTVQPHWKMKQLSGTACPHYPDDQVGDPVFTRL